MKSRKTSPKLRALRASGTLNRAAEAVRDAAFASGEFFDAHDLVQVRYEMLRRVRTEGQSVAHTVARFGVSRPTFYKALAAFDRAGLVGLLPAKRGPHGPHKITAEVQAFIEQQQLLAEPALDGPALVLRIAQRFGVAVHRRTVERALARSKKKTALSKTPSESASDGQALLERYECLRRTVMQRDAAQPDIGGLALLMRQGMAVWMRTLGAPGAALGARSEATASSAPCGLAARPASLEQLLVNIVAAMALVHAQEVCA